MPLRFEEILPDLFIRPDFDGASVIVTFSKPRKISGGGGWMILDGRKKIASGRVPAGRKVKFIVPMKGFTPWTVDNPHLYELRLKLKRDGKAVEVAHLFGMCKFHVADKQIFMNNKPLYVRGYIRGREAHDHPNLSGLPEKEYHEKNIRAARAFGFNCVRFHSKVPSQEFLDAADRSGILVHVEIRRYFGKYQAERALMDHNPVLVDPRLWRETIKRIRNHPSLLVYCLGNEINKPGRTPEVKARAVQLRKLDDTKLFLDTCARGEYDRGGVDLDVQHFGYFAPFGEHCNMFDITDNWSIFGSVREIPMQTGYPEALTRRSLEANVPVLAHETAHYIALHDLDELERKFKRYKAPAPWWIDELKKLVKFKGLEKDYPDMVRASRHFQYIWHKQVFESIRKSPVLNGFQFLQLSDTDRYENCNGLVDCFDDFKKDLRPREYLPFNSDMVIVADLPRRTFFEKESLAVPVLLSNCSEHDQTQGVLTWSLKSPGGEVNLKGRMPKLDVRGGLRKIVEIDIALPEIEDPAVMELKISIKTESGAKSANSWKLWLFPNRPEKLSIREAIVSLHDVDLYRRYPRMLQKGLKTRGVQLMITDSFGSEVFEHLERGGDVLMLYRIPETRDRTAKREKYYMPSTWDRFKPVIWDRGHNLGAFIRPHPALRRFPNDGLLDFQFFHVVDDCDKFSLDDFPVPVEPVVQGVDKASRDRYDVFTFKLKDLQPGWTMRKFAYLFDLRVGRGRLMMSAFNFTGLNSHAPAACGLFESLAACATSSAWKPKTRISPADLKSFLKKMGRKPRIKERMMTQYWQLDDAPLESARYWKEAEAWIREKD